MWKGFGFRRLLTVSLFRRSGSMLSAVLYGFHVPIKGLSLVRPQPMTTLGWKSFNTRYRHTVPQRLHQWYYLLIRDFGILYRAPSGSSTGWCLDLQMSYLRWCVCCQLPVGCLSFSHFVVRDYAVDIDKISVASCCSRIPDKDRNRWIFCYVEVYSGYRLCLYQQHLSLKSQLMISSIAVLMRGKTRSSAVAERPRDALCLSVVSFNIPTAQFFLFLLRLQIY